LGGDPLTVTDAVFPQVTRASAERAIREGQAVQALRELPLWQELEVQWARHRQHHRASLCMAPDVAVPQADIFGAQALQEAVWDIITGGIAGESLASMPVERPQVPKMMNDEVAAQMRQQGERAREVIEHPGFKLVCERLAGICHGLHVALAVADPAMQLKLQAVLRIVMAPLMTLKEMLRRGLVAAQWTQQQEKEAERRG
jgi:hypothetical protein